MYPGVYPSSLRLQTSNFTLIFILCSWPFFALGDSLSFSRRWSKVYTLSSQRRTVKLQLWRLGFYKKGPMGRGGSNVSCKCMGQLCRDFPENSFFCLDWCHSCWSLFYADMFLKVSPMCKGVFTLGKRIIPRKLQHTSISHTQSAIPIANYERNPEIYCCW